VVKEGATSGVALWYHCYDYDYDYDYSIPRETVVKEGAEVCLIGECVLVRPVRASIEATKKVLALRYRRY